MKAVTPKFVPRLLILLFCVAGLAFGISQFLLNQEAERNASLLWRPAPPSASEVINRLKARLTALEQVQCQTYPQFDVNQPGHIYGYETRCH